MHTNILLMGQYYAHEMKSNKVCEEKRTDLYPMTVTVFCHCL